MGAGEGSSNMSWLPKRETLDPVQASAVDFALAQEGNFSIKGENAVLEYPQF